MRHFIKILILLSSITLMSPQNSSEIIISGDKLYENAHISVSTAYPNPAIENVNFNYKLSETAGDFKMVLTDVLGNQVGQYKLSKEFARLQIPVSQLPEGVYFYTLYSESKALITRKFIVNS
jgi:Secretion system C-terminal sorting domain